MKYPLRLLCTLQPLTVRRGLKLMLTAPSVKKLVASSTALSPPRPILHDPTALLVPKATLSRPNSSVALLWLVIGLPARTTTLSLVDRLDIERRTLYTPLLCPSGPQQRPSSHPLVPTMPLLPFPMEHLTLHRVQQRPLPGVTATFRGKLRSTLTVPTPVTILSLAIPMSATIPRFPVTQSLRPPTDLHFSLAMSMRPPNLVRLSLSTTRLMAS